MSEAAPMETGTPSKPALAQNPEHPALTILLLLVLAAAVFVTFWPAVHAKFVDMDDEKYVFGPDPPERPGHTWDGLTPGNILWAATARHGGLWQPMTWWSLQLDATITGWMLGGIPKMPQPLEPFPSVAIYHVDNMILHALSAWMLFFFVRRATGNLWAAFIAALLWTVHPLRVESVAWVTERKDVLSGVFGFAALHAYVRARRQQSTGWIIWAWMAMLLAVMAKSTYVTLPLIFVLLDFWPLGRLTGGRGFWRRVLEKWPFFMISLLAAAATALASRRNGAAPVGGAEQIANAIVSYIRYLWMQLDVRNLAPFYPFEPLDSLKIAGAAALLIAVTAFCWWQRKRWPWLMVGWAWYLIALLPMIGFVQRGSQAYADRYTYFPAVGLFLMLALSVPAHWFRNIARTTTIVGLAIVLAGLMTVRSYHQTELWHDSVTLFEHSLAVTPDNAPVHAYLANGYVRAGQPDLVVRECQRLAALSPRSSEEHLRIAGLLMRISRPDLAVDYAKRATELEDSSRTHQRYAMALSALNRWEEAVHEYEAAVHFDVTNTDMFNALQDARMHAATRQWH